MLPDVEEPCQLIRLMINLKACSCGCEEFIGEEDVLDTWMDSSILPLSIAGWPNEGYEKTISRQISVHRDMILSEHGHFIQHFVVLL